MQRRLDDMLAWAALLFLALAVATLYLVGETATVILLVLAGLSLIAQARAPAAPPA